MWGKEASQLLPRRSLSQYHERRQARLAGPFPEGEHRRRPHPGVTLQRHLDFPRLDAEAPYLDLVIDAPEVLRVTVRQPAREIAGAVQALPRHRRKGVGQETPGREVRPAQVAPCHTRSAHEDLSRNPDRHRPSMPVQQPEPQVGQRTADRAGRLRPRVGAPQQSHRDVDCGLGDPVHVDQTRHSLAMALVPGAQVPRAQGLSAEDHQAQRQPAADGLFDVRLGLNELPEGGRSLVEDRHLLLDQQAPHSLGRAAHPVGDDDQPATAGEGSPDLPDREVERVGVKERPDIGGTEFHAGACRREQADGARVLDQNSLGPAGGTRGVNDISQRARVRGGGSREPTAVLLVRPVQAQRAGRHAEHGLGRLRMGDHHAGALACEGVREDQA